MEIWMGTPQKAINDLRNGDFNETITLIKHITEHYTPITRHVIAQDELQQLMAYELAQTDINEDDLRKLHIIDRLVDGGDILSHLPGAFKASLLFTLTACCSAISIKKVENYQLSLPQEITRNNIRDFLNHESEFSLLVSKPDCQESIANLNSFIIDNSDANSINSLFKLEEGTPFRSG